MAITSILNTNKLNRIKQQLTERDVLRQSSSTTSGALISQRLSDEITFLPAGSIVTASGSVSGTYDASWVSSGVVFVNVSSISGTSPAITVNVTSTDFLSGESYNLASSSALTAVGFAAITIPIVYGDEIGISYTVGGTSPSITLSITGVFKS